MEIGDITPKTGTTASASSQADESLPELFQGRDFSEFLSRVRDVRRALVSLESLRPRVITHSSGSGFALRASDQRKAERALTELADAFRQLLDDHRFDLDTQAKDFVRERFAAVLSSQGLAGDGETVVATGFGVGFDFTAGVEDPVDLQLSKLRETLDSGDGLALAELFTSEGGASNLTSALIKAIDRIEVDLEEARLEAPGLGVFLDLAT